MNHAPTWDAMYNGRLLTRAEYASHLRILKKVEAGEGRLTALALNDEVDEDNGHVATIALYTSGLIVNNGVDSKSPDFVWDTVRLTELGKRYLSERS